METTIQRKRCGTSKREAFILNTRNPKERAIYEFLISQYNKSDTIKDILYDYIMGNGLDDNKFIVNDLQNDDKHVISQNTHYINDYKEIKGDVCYGR